FPRSPRRAGCARREGSRPRLEARQDRSPRPRGRADASRLHFVADQGLAVPGASREDRRWFGPQGLHPLREPQGAEVSGLPQELLASSARDRREAQRSRRGAAIRLKIEDGSKLRVDTTVVETDVHYPTDSTLLYDGIRTVSRLVLEHLEAELPGVAEDFPDRRRRARRRMQEISRMRDRRGKNDRAFRRKYGDLLEVAREVGGKASSVVDKA